jgi:pyruvate dehydrogenase E2 component (dihydrolipoamide acetyltransferase)
MATSILLPRQGQTVESCIIVGWKKAVGDRVAVGDILAEVETDKATIDIESTADGVLLEQLVKLGDDVPVLTPIALVGEPGERAAAPMPDTPHTAHAGAAPQPGERAAPSPSLTAGVAVSPRARALAARLAVDPAALTGTGPHGRVIARDIERAAAQAQAVPTAERPRMTPLAAAMLERGGYQAPAAGSGVGGKITTRDLRSDRDLRADTAPEPVSPAESPAPPAVPAQPLPNAADDGVTHIPIRGVRKVIAERMTHSLHSTAQLTMTAYADARALLAYRARLKSSPEALGLRGITINTLVLYAVARTLPAFPDLNATVTQAEGEGVIAQYAAVHLGFAVDTPRGLLVPVVRDAHARSLRALADAADALAAAAQNGRLAPDAMTGGTFTVSNLGAFGIESFTPILNPPQVAILGVGAIAPRPITDDAGETAFAPHLALSLTVDHRVVDGAPAARFVQALARAIASFDLILAG